MSYTKLIADVPSFTARSDFTTAQLEKFITLAEDKINRMVRVGEMRHTVTQEAYCDPETTDMVFKLISEMKRPLAIRAKDSSGATLRSYDQTPQSAFDQRRQDSSKIPIWTPDPISVIPATLYDGSTCGGKTSVDISSTDTFSFHVCFRFDELATSNDIMVIADGTWNKFRVRVTAAGAVNLITRQADDSAQVSHTFSDLTVTEDTWHRLLISYSNVTSTVHAYLDDTASADTPTFNNSGEVDLSGNFLRIGCGFNNSSVEENFCRADITQLGFSTVFLNFSDADVRARVFAAGATGAPIQYGTGRGREVFGQNAEIWMPDGAADKNYGTEKTIKIIKGYLKDSDSEDLGVVSDLFGIKINPAIGDGTEYIELKYLAEFPRLTSTNDTHWLADNHYDLYLYGCLAEAYDFLMDEQREIAYRGKMSGVIDSINTTAQRKLRGTGPFIRRNSRRVTP